MATIKDVAKEAGVSVATVSRAMNSSGYVHEDTLKKINRAIETLKYKPNETARTLYKKQSKIIGLLLPDISNPFFTVVARGVEDAALERGFHVVIGNSDQNLDKERQYIDTFRLHNCVGLISSALVWEDALQYIQSSQMLHVMLDRIGETEYSVEADHYKGGVLQAECLLDNGCKNILVINGNMKFSSFKHRLEGAIHTLEESGAVFETLELNSEGVGHALLEQIKHKAYDGIICYNDLIAIQVMGLLQHNGVNVPGDVQVVGYDDIQISASYFPSLTTVRQPSYLLGRLACEQLIDLLNGKQVKKEIKIDVSLVERKSTRSE